MYDEGWAHEVLSMTPHGVTEINEERRAYNFPGHPITWEQRTPLDLSAAITPLLCFLNLVGYLHSLPHPEIPNTKRGEINTFIVPTIAMTLQA